jgi:hypothetical protein
MAPAAGTSNTKGLPKSSIDANPSSQDGPVIYLFAWKTYFKKWRYNYNQKSVSFKPSLIAMSSALQTSVWFLSNIQSQQFHV